MATFSPEVIRLAQESEKKWGVPASVTLAQYALESGYGTSSVAKNANNYFGIKGSYNGQRYGQYRKYSSMAQSFDDHGRLLATSDYYKDARTKTNVNDYIDAFAEIYAPSSDGNNDYAGQLKKIIADNNLTQYDNGKITGGAVDTGRASGGRVSGGSSPDTATGIFGKIAIFIVVLIVAFIGVKLFIAAFDL